MTVGVLAVGRLVGRADRSQRESAGRQVEERVRGLAQDAEAPCKDPDHELGHDQRHADGQGAQSDELWTAFHPSHGFTLSARLEASATGALSFYLSFDADSKS